MPTNVPAPIFTPTGFVAPSDSAILAGVADDINTAFGGNLNFGTTTGSPTNATPQGQLAASMAAIIGNVNDTFLFFSTQTDPAFAEGRMQDAIGRIYFIERIGALPTVLQIQCVGAAGTVIPVGALVVDPGNNLYGALAGGTIGAGGSATIAFTATVSGSIAVPSSVAIYQAITGWDTATILSGVQGQSTESRAAFERRRGLSTAANSLGSLPSVLGTVLSVPGVTNAYVFENTSASPIVQGNVTLAPNSLYVAAFGGAPQAVAQAIWSRKAPGCNYGAGNTTVTVEDTSPGYAPPFPSYQVTYQIPNPLPLLFSVSIVNSAQVPANATTLIANAIINAGAGNPNAQNIVDGPAVTIGAKIWASRFVPSIAALGTWAAGNVISLQIGSNNDADAASVLGYCSGTSLIVASLLSGTLSAGQTVSISNGSGVIIPGTTIVSQVSGSTGGTGVYTISTLQSFGLANLLIESNAFATSWGSLGSPSLTANAVTDPFGGNNGWLWQRTGTLGSFTFQGINSFTGKPASALPYTFSIYAKAAIGSYVALVITDQLPSGAAEATFNLLTGQVTIAANSTGAFGISFAAIQNAGGGWWRCSLTVTTSTISNLTVAFSGNSNNVFYNQSDSVANSSIFVFGAQLEPDPVANPYIATTSNILIDTVLGFATADEASVQVHIDQMPQIAAQNIAVTYV